MTNRSLVIGELGGRGDGIVETPDGPLYVPFALPGETVTVRGPGNRPELVSIDVASPARVAPACGHFGVCGGCSVQHLDAASYGDWKRGNLVRALERAGIVAMVGELAPCAPATRRRAAFTVSGYGGRLRLGFNRMRGNELVDIGECPVLVPAITDRLDALRVVAGMVSRSPRPFRMLVTATTSGLDIAVENAGRLAEKARRNAAEFTARSGFARLTVDGEIVLEPKKPAVMFGDVAVNLPPGAFLQATQGSEALMADAVAGHLRGCRRIADLFSGCGSFALRLAREGAVHAVEADAPAIDALDRAARHASGLKPVTVERRDLFRRPLTAREFDRFDGLVFDPPRAGAEAQARHIAGSKVGRVAAVSCNPATLARDLRILVDGGYRIERVMPVDQFLWSHHVEAVALLER